MAVWAERSAGAIAGEVVERGVDAAAPMRHAGDAQPHLDAAQRAGEHEVVEIAEMADAEDLVGEPACAPPA